jgi:AcrR family transcriptional regulator
VAGPANCPARYFSDFVEGRRGEILDAALVVFQEKGYAGGTMRDVASRLGVTEPALYRHYAGKEALYADLLGLAGDHVVETARARMADVRPETLRSSLLGLIARGGPRRGHKKGGMLLGTLIASAPHDEALMEAFRVRLAQPMVASIREFVPRIDAFFGIARSPAELERAVRVFVSLFVGYFATSKTLGLADDDEAILDAILLVMGWTGSGPAKA